MAKITKKAGAQTKAPAAPPEPRLIEAASKTSEIGSLVRLARVFTRVGARGAYTVDIPLFSSMHIAGKGFRKGNIPVGSRMTTDIVRIGKREGLIFRFGCLDEFKRNGEAVEYVEVSWPDIVNTMPGLHAVLVELLGAKFIDELDTTLRSVVGKNPSMHAVLEQGFVKAQHDEKADIGTDELQDNPLFGAFG